MRKISILFGTVLLSLVGCSGAAVNNETNNTNNDAISKEKYYELLDEIKDLKEKIDTLEAKTRLLEEDELELRALNNQISYLKDQLLTSESDRYYESDKFNKLSFGTKNSDTYVDLEIPEEDKSKYKLTKAFVSDYYYANEDAYKGKFDFDYSFVNFVAKTEICEILDFLNSETKIISTNEEYASLKEEIYKLKTNCRNDAFPDIDFGESKIAVTLFFEDSDFYDGLFDTTVSSISIVDNGTIRQFFDNSYPLEKPLKYFSYGLCIVKLAKDDNYNFQTVFRHDNNSDLLARKPIIYFYPKEEMNLTVKYVNEEKLLTTYPKYNDDWNIHLNEDGTFTTNNSDREYYALYFDEKANYICPFDEGFYVTKENAISFLEEKMDYMGFTNRETNEFIMYWLPILEDNEKSLVYFEQNDIRNAECPLEFSTNPDSLIRTIIHIKKVDEETEIKEQVLTHYDRTGFVVTEWGGVNY